jgi:hypothetical protein
MHGTCMLDWATATAACSTSSVCRRSTSQMADAKPAAGIGSATIAALVFLVALFWRWQQRQRDREALLASLEQQFAEKVHIRDVMGSVRSQQHDWRSHKPHLGMLPVLIEGGHSVTVSIQSEVIMSQRLSRGPQVQPALAYLSALKRKYSDHQQLWCVLMARAPPGSQQHKQFLKDTTVACVSVTVPQVGQAPDIRRQQPEGQEAQRLLAMHLAADAAGGNVGSMSDPAALSRHEPAILQSPLNGNGGPVNVSSCAACNDQSPIQHPAQNADGSSVRSASASAVLQHPSSQGLLAVHSGTGC